MSDGLQIFDSGGNLTLDTTHFPMRLIATFTVSNATQGGNPSYTQPVTGMNTSGDWVVTGASKGPYSTGYPQIYEGGFTCYLMALGDDLPRTFNVYRSGGLLDSIPNDYGLQVVNDTGTVQLDGVTDMLIKVASGTLTSGSRVMVQDIPNISSSRVVYVRPTAPTGVLESLNTVANLDIPSTQCIALTCTTGTYDYVVYDKASAHVPSNTVDIFGLEVYGTAGNLLYSAFQKPLLFTSYFSITPGNLDNKWAPFTGYSPYFGNVTWGGVNVYTKAFGIQKVDLKRFYINIEILNASGIYQDGATLATQADFQTDEYPTDYFNRIQFTGHIQYPACQKQIYSGNNTTTYGVFSYRPLSFIVE